MNNNNIKADILYLPCAEVEESVAYQAGMASFCDYIIPVDMTQQEFDSHFWGAEGNRKEISYIALDGDEPIGLVFSGIRVFDGLKTMRCGMLGIAPAYRGSGAARELMKLHWQEAVNQGCDRLFLEVIKGNDRAISFYRKLGYVDAYDIKYYNFTKKDLLKTESPADTELRDASFEEIASLRESLPDVHIHWQREMAYIGMCDYNYTILESEGNIAGAVAYNARNIPFLYVLPRYRQRGFGRMLLNHTLERIPDDGKLVLSFTNNASLEMFCRSCNGEKDKISQFEMYRPVGDVVNL